MIIILSVYLCCCTQTKTQHTCYPLACQWSFSLYVSIKLVGGEGLPRAKMAVVFLTQSQTICFMFSLTVELLLRR